MTRTMGMKRKTTLRAMLKLAVGIVLSVAGAGLMVVALVFSIALGPSPQWNLGFGHFFIAMAGFLVCAAGTDLRVSAQRVSTPS